MATESDPEAFLAKALALARAAGCDGAEILLTRSNGQHASVRKGAVQKIERMGEAAFGLRVFSGRRHASVSSSDFKPEALKEAVERAAAIARSAPEDPFAGLAEKGAFFVGPAPDLDLLDPAEVSIEALKETAHKAEGAALAVTGVTNSEGAEASSHRARFFHATSEGFFSDVEMTFFSLSAIAIAGQGGGMERDYDYSTARHFKDLDPAARIGTSAAERAVARLAPRKVKTGKCPVVFDRRVSKSLLGHLAGALNGRAVAKGASFLARHIGEKVFPAGVSVIDDPLRKKGLASQPFDGEGIEARARKIVDSGVLASWFLDLASARELKVPTTGHASSSLAFGGGPAPTNLYFENGTDTKESLLKRAGAGLLVTEVMGTAVNLSNGDYSRGAAGFWFERGEIAHPVNGVTIAGNLRDMFLNAVAASDLEFKDGINAPSLLVEGMTVAGA